MSMLDNQETQSSTQLNAPLLYEMIRSFVVLSRHLNLSRAVDELGSTRQTVRRHIDFIEDAMGEKLFEVIDRRYQLTEAGRRALPSAETIVAQGYFWLTGQLQNVDGMMVLSYVNPGGHQFHQQQQPLSRVWTGKSELLKAAVKAWAESEGQLEHEAMAVVRPYILVYRDTPAGWMCVEIGERSFYSKWWGWANARSSIGRVLEQFQGGPEVAAIMQTPFTEVQNNHGLRLDQTVTHIPRLAGGPFEPVVFHRLLMGVYFADGSNALAVVVDRADRVDIEGLDEANLEGMPQDVIVEFPAEN
jgi:hypothetical protein